MLVQNFTTQRMHSADSSSAYPKLRPLPSHSNKPLFPTGASRRLPFFCVPQGPLLQPIIFSLFSGFLKETITAIGLDAMNLCPHSFRRGGVTHAYQSGVPDHLIKLHGHWCSEAYKLYLSLSLAKRTRAADVIAPLLFNTASSRYHFLSFPIPI